MAPKRADADRAARADISARKGSGCELSHAGVELLTDKASFQQAIKIHWHNGFLLSACQGATGAAAGRWKRAKAIDPGPPATSSVAFQSAD